MTEILMKMATILAWVFGGINLLLLIKNLIGAGRYPGSNKELLDKLKSQTRHFPVFLKATVVIISVSWIVASW